jgi:hypothetical protein
MMESMIQRVSETRFKAANMVIGEGNIQHPTSNIQSRKAGRRRRPHSLHWMFGVGCWLLDVFSFFPRLPVTEC